VGEQIREQPNERIGEQMIGGVVHVEIAQDEEDAKCEEDRRTDLKPAVTTEIHFR